MSDERPVLLSVPWSSPWAGEAHPAQGVTVRVRGIDWQLTAGRRLMHALQEALGTLRASRGASAIVLCTTGADAVLLALLMRLRRSQTFVVYDFLLPRRPVVRRLGRWALRRVDLWLVIRRGDAETFRRELAARRCAFVPFPVPHQPAPVGSAEPFVYAAGTAHRDWSTLLAACRHYDGRLLISTDAPLDVPPELAERVVVRRLVPPEVGRAFIGAAAAVCVPLVETDLPSGPLVVLDALAAGKALVVTDANGSRDYVRPNATALVVPPGDPEALGRALTAVMSSEPLRARLGQAGRRAVEPLSSERVLAEITSAVVGDRPSPPEGEAREN